MSSEKTIVLKRRPCPFCAPGRKAGRSVGSPETMRLELIEEEVPGRWQANMYVRNELLINRHGTKEEAIRNFRSDFEKYSSAFSKLEGSLDFVFGEDDG